MIFAILGGLIFLSAKSEAAVRSVEATDQAITPVYLSLGRSTVLRFREKPRKVVVGNQNYFNIEFIDNDLAIQPTGLVATNLFVYGESHNYGFNLRVSSTGTGDDLIHVAWYLPSVELKSTPSRVLNLVPQKVKNIGQKISLGSDLQMKFERVVYLPTKDILWSEVVFFVSGKTPVDVKDIGFSVSEWKKVNIKTRLVCKRMQIERNEKTTCRFFVAPSRYKNKTLIVKYKKFESRLLFSKP